MRSLQFELSEDALGPVRNDPIVLLQDVRMGQRAGVGILHAAYLLANGRLNLRLTRSGSRQGVSSRYFVTLSMAICISRPTAYQSLLSACTSASSGDGLAL